MKDLLQTFRLTLFTEIVMTFAFFLAIPMENPLFSAPHITIHSIECTCDIYVLVFWL